MTRTSLYFTLDLRAPVASFGSLPKCPEVGSGLGPSAGSGWPRPARKRANACRRFPATAAERARRRPSAGVSGDCAASIRRAPRRQSASGESATWACVETPLHNTHTTQSDPSTPPIKKHFLNLALKLT